VIQGDRMLPVPVWPASGGRGIIPRLRNREICVAMHKSRPEARTTPRGPGNGNSNLRVLWCGPPACISTASVRPALIPPWALADDQTRGDRDHRHSRGDIVAGPGAPARSRTPVELPEQPQTVRAGAEDVQQRVQRRHVPARAASAGGPPGVHHVAAMLRGVPRIRDGFEHLRVSFQRQSHRARHVLRGRSGGLDSGAVQPGRRPAAVVACRVVLSVPGLGVRQAQRGQPEDRCQSHRGHHGPNHAHRHGPFRSRHSRNKRIIARFLHGRPRDHGRSVRRPCCKFERTR